MHGKCPSCCGTHQRFPSFQQLLLWSHSCPSVTQAAKVAPSLLHLIWAENDRQGSEGDAAVGGRWGPRVQLPKAVRILPGHPLNEDLPSWSFSMAGDFSKSTTCFCRSPEQKSLFVGMKSMAEIFPSVPSAFKGVSVSPPPLAPCCCSKPSSCVLVVLSRLAFFIIDCSSSLMFWDVSPGPLDSHADSFSLSLPESPTHPSSQRGFEPSCRISPTASPTSWSCLLPC